MEVFEAMDPVQKILSIDNLRRNQRHWPLIPIERWKEFDNQLWLESDNCPYKREKNSNSCRFFQLESPVREVDHVKCEFPNLSYLLSIFKGKLAACGGVFTNREMSGNRDVDLFFVGCTTEMAENILGEAIIYLAQNYKNHLIDKFDDEFKDVRIERRLYVTNVVVQSTGDGAVKYQFIHRIYPDIGSVLGGFDIGASMVAWDGDKVWATELGAWTFANRTVIVDIKRRSTTFGKRLAKYHHRGFDILFPGFPKDVKFFGDRTFEDKVCEIQKLYPTVMVHFKCGGEYDYDFDYSYDCHFNDGNRSWTHGGKKWNHLEEDHEICLELLKEKKAELQREFIDFRVYRNQYRTGNGECVDMSRNTFNVGLTREEFKLASDYGDWCYPMGSNLMYINTSVLTNELLDGATAFIFKDDIVNRSSSHIRECYHNLVKKPVIRWHRITINYFRAMNSHQRILAEFKQTFPKTPERSTAECIRIAEILNKRAEANANICEKRLTGITWITQDPGRQWTSSINPVITEAKEYYQDLYVPCLIGIDPGVEALLRFFMNNKLGVWALISKDIFRLIMIKIIESYVSPWEATPITAVSFVSRSQFSHNQNYGEWLDRGSSPEPLVLDQDGNLCSTYYDIVSKK